MRTSSTAAPTASTRCPRTRGAALTAPCSRPATRQVGGQSQLKRTRQAAPQAVLLKACRACCAGERATPRLLRLPRPALCPALCSLRWHFCRLASAAPAPATWALATPRPTLSLRLESNLNKLIKVVTLPLPADAAVAKYNLEEMQRAERKVCAPHARHRHWFCPCGRKPSRRASPARRCCLHACAPGAGSPKYACMLSLRGGHAASAYTARCLGHLAAFAFICPDGAASRTSSRLLQEREKRGDSWQPRWFKPLPADAGECARPERACPAPTAAHPGPAPPAADRPQQLCGACRWRPPSSLSARWTSRPRLPNCNVPPSLPVWTLPAEILPGEYSNEECPQYEFTGDYLQLEARPPSKSEGGRQAAGPRPRATPTALRRPEVSACPSQECCGRLQAKRMWRAAAALPSAHAQGVHCLSSSQSHAVRYCTTSSLPSCLSTACRRRSVRHGLCALVLPRHAPAAWQGGPAVTAPVRHRRTLHHKRSDRRNASRGGRCGAREHAVGRLLQQRGACGCGCGSDERAWWQPSAAPPGQMVLPAASHCTPRSGFTQDGDTTQLVAPALPHMLPSALIAAPRPRPGPQ